ncbi:MAG: Gfo/Idh/MocA family protein [Armatimonadota bacterium]
MADEVRIGLIGCGRIMPAHLRGMKLLREAGYDRFRVTALMARNIDDALRFRRRGEGPPPRPPASENPNDPLGVEHRYVSDVHEGEVEVYDDLDAMLAEAPIDAVEVFTTHSTHHSIAIRALEAGKHVAVEKPMALTCAAARRMIEAAERSERTLMVLENHRFWPHVRAAAWAAQSGLLGAVQMVVSMSVGAGEWSPDVILGHTPWRHDRLAGGGCATDFGPHLLDWARQVGGEIETVSAVTRCVEPVRREYDDAGEVVREIAADADDTFFAHLQFSGGAVGSLGFSAAGHGDPIALPGGRAVYGSAGCLQQGKAILDDGTRAPVEELYLGRADPAEPAARFPLGLRDAFALETHQFVEAIRSGERPELSGEEGLRDLAAAFAIHESALAGCEVRVDDVASGAVAAYQDELNRRWGIR